MADSTLKYNNTSEVKTLQSGINYWSNGNIVTLVINGPSFTIPFHSESGVLFTMPEGYRPKGPISFPCRYTRNEGGAYPMLCMHMAIGTNGEARVNGWLAREQTETGSFWATVTYLV